jgi:hypothetical protein
MYHIEVKQRRSLAAQQNNQLADIRMIEDQRGSCSGFRRLNG